MGKLDVEIQPGVTIKTTVLNNSDATNTCVLKFRSSIVGNVVGLDVKLSRSSFSSKIKSASLLVLSSGSQYLIIQLRKLWHIPDDLHSLLIDKNICFVGIHLCKKLEILQMNWNQLSTDSLGVELGYLAARVFAKPSLAKCTVWKELAEEIGIDYKFACIVKPEISPNWSAKILSHYEIKLAVQDAYAWLVFGKTILDKV